MSQKVIKRIKKFARVSKKLYKRMKKDYKGMNISERTSLNKQLKSKGGEK